MDNLPVTPEQNLEQAVISPPPKINPMYIIGGLIFIAVILTGGIFIGRFMNSSQKIPEKEILLTPTSYPSPTVTSIPDPTAEWKTYSSDSHKFTFKYPQNWLGPEEYNDYYVSIGSSKPHKYGEGIEYDFPTTDSYFVTILSNYRGTMPISTWESQTWMADTKESISLAVGKSTTSHGIRKTKIRNGTVGDLPVSEVLIDNDPQGAGAEFMYTNEIIVKTSDFVIRIQAIPVIVSTKDSLDRQNKAKEISNKYKETLNQILSTFKFLDQKQNMEQSCLERGGRWIAQYNECESESSPNLTAEWCTNNGGTFEGCSSACRYDPDVIAGRSNCAAICVKVCKFN